MECFVFDGAHFTTTNTYWLRRDAICICKKGDDGCTPDKEDKCRTHAEEEDTAIAIRLDGGISLNDSNNIVDVTVEEALKALNAEVDTVNDSDGLDYSLRKWVTKRFSENGGIDLPWISFE